MFFEAANYPVSVGLERYYSRYTELYKRRRDYYDSWFRINYGRISNPLCRFIRKYPAPGDEMEKGCQQLITNIVSRHEPSDCRYTGHCDLYLAAKIAFAAKLSDSKTVANLLNEIFNCKKTFSELFTGALFDPKNTEEGGSWFSDREECLEAMEYFLYQASMERMVFSCNGTLRRMVDLCVRGTEYDHPVMFVLKKHDTKLFRILFQYGINIFDYSVLLFGGTRGQIIVRSSVYNLLRIIEQRNLWKPGQKECREIFLREIIYANKGVPSLLAICKKVTRKLLDDNHRLPHGISILEIPNTVKSFLNLEY